MTDVVQAPTLINVNVPVSQIVTQAAPVQVAVRVLETSQVETERVEHIVIQEERAGIAIIAVGAQGPAGSGSGSASMSPPALDGEPGEEGMPIPGQAGSPGPMGATGAPAPMIPGMDGEPGEEGMPVPGATGPAGTPAPMIPGMDGDPADDGMPIPGATGATGASAPMIPGADGEPGDEGMPVPGATGATGASAPMIPGADGEPGDEGMPVPGQQGTPGTAGAAGAPAPMIPGLDGEHGEDGMPIPSPTGSGSVPTGTGFVHITGGAQDAAARAIDLSSADASGILAAARFPALTGDVTTSAGALATTIAAAAVTLAKMENRSTQTFIGRNTAGLGVPEELSIATAKTMLNLSGTNSGDQTITLTGDVTGSGAGSFAATIVAAAVTLAKMENRATQTFIGRNTAGTGTPEELSIATAKTMLSLTGTNSGDQTITLTGDVTGTGTGSFAATIVNNAVTNAKAADMATQTFKGRNTAATGDPEDLSIATAKTMLGVPTFAGPQLFTAANLSPNATRDITSLPAGISRVDINLATVSTNGTSNIIIQLGSSATIQTTGYVGRTKESGIASIAYTSGFLVTVSVGATSVNHGIVSLRRLAPNTWIAMLIISDTVVDRGCYGSGQVTLAGALDSIRVTMVNGTDVFDSGTMSIVYD